MTIEIDSETVLDSGWLRELCLDAGADDVGFAALDDPALAEERPYADEILPGTQTLIALVARMNRENVRSRARSVGNAEYFATADVINHTSAQVVRALEDEGVRAANPSMAFPMEFQRFGARPWPIRHKTVAVAAGLGHMGIHRNVIHPRFGNFILLGTVLIQPRVSEYATPLEWNPCLGCNLCVAACPVGAIKVSGEFDFLACYTHNYREHLSGFREWAGRIADADSAEQYGERVTEAESAAVWQNLSAKPMDYLSGYCVSVCPAGEDVIGPFLDDRKQHVREFVRPLQQRPEPIYVSPGSEAEEHVRKRFPNKVAAPVWSGPRLEDDITDPVPLPREQLERDDAAGR